MTVLITGANGMTGRAVLTALARRGVHVRALATREASAQALCAAGAGETALARFDDAPALAAAMRGIDTVFHVPPRMKPEEVANGRAVIAAARTAGVRRIVLHSVVNPQLQAIRFHVHKRLVEEAVIESGLPWVILQPTNYMQNVVWQWARLVAQGELLFPYAAEAPVSWLDLDDYAEGAARVLSEAGFDYGTYEMVSTAAPLTRHQMAAVWSRVLGREVRATTMPLADYMALPHWAGRDPREMAILRTMFEAFDRYGAPGGNRRVLAMLLGREPTGYEDFARRLADERGGRAQ
ncbi:MAG: NmrA family NAD(P)-binding protein [Burkholderiales bacterium]|nr:NmrA family NAD(P)-binding protein [Burkholderiales bacterium]